MAPEDQKFFEACRSLFITDGWKFFLTEIQAAHAGCNNLDALSTAEEFWVAKGKAEVLRQVLGWESAVLAAEASAEESAEDA